MNQSVKALCEKWKPVFARTMRQNKRLDQRDGVMSNTRWSMSPVSRATETLTDQDDLTTSFGTPAERVARAVAQIRAGGSIVVIDDEDRENEGDIICAAETLTVAQMAQMIRDCSGIVCLILTDADATRLELPPMVSSNTSSYGTGFTVSIEARHGVTTGVSAADRVTTIKTAIAPHCQPADLARPGHVFPIRANPGGLAARQGHSEATIDLMRRAGRQPAGVLCEVTNPDGTMARLPELIVYARQHGMPLVTIADLIAHPDITG